MTPRTLSVLIVDPFRDETEMYQQFLHLEGFDVRAFDDVEAAFSTAVDTPPDVILTRLRQASPDRDGIELARALRKHPAACDVPIVMISTSIQAADRHAALAAGCDRFVLLPCAPEELAIELRRAVSRRQLRRDLTRIGRSAKASLPADSAPRDARKYLRH